MLSRNISPNRRPPPGHPAGGQPPLSPQNYHRNNLRQSLLCVPRSHSLILRSLRDRNRRGRKTALTYQGFRHGLSGVTLSCPNFHRRWGRASAPSDRSSAGCLVLRIDLPSPFAIIHTNAWYSVVPSTNFVLLRLTFSHFTPYATRGVQARYAQMWNRLLQGLLMAACNDWSNSVRDCW